MPRVRVKNGPNRGLVYQVGNEAITVGRDTSSVIQILDRGASRNHAEIFRIGEMCFIRDLGSRNGTYVNDSTVSEELLREGDRIQIGSTVIAFESEAPMDGDTRQIDVTREDPEEGEVSGTLELRLEDLVGFESSDAEIDRDSANLRAIVQITKIIAGERSERALMDKILSYIADLVPADNIFIFLRDKQTNHLVPRARYEKAPDLGTKISKGIIRRAMKERRSILSSDAMSDARFKARDSIIVNLIRSVICVPFINQDHVLGVLYMTCNRVGESFVEEDLELGSAVATQVALALDNIHYRKRQQESYLSVVRTLMAVTDLRNPDTHGHSERVCAYAAAIASQMELSDQDWLNVQLGALLHDIGKLALESSESASDEFHLPPEADPGSSQATLTRGKTLRDHPALGAEIASNIIDGADVADAIRHHHELHSGQGYPHGLEGDEIPLLARIVAVADRLDHLTTLGGESDEGLSMKAALMALDREAGNEFDPAVIRALHISHRNGSLYSPHTIFGDPAESSVPPAREVPEMAEDEMAG